MRHYYVVELNTDTGRSREVGDFATGDEVQDLADARRMLDDLRAQRREGNPEVHGLVVEDYAEGARP